MVAGGGGLVAKLAFWLLRPMDYNAPAPLSLRILRQNRLVVMSFSIHVHSSDPILKDGFLFVLNVQKVLQNQFP